MPIAIRFMMVRYRHQLRSSNITITLTVLFQRTLFKPPIYGAYSELYAALSPELEEKHNGGYLLAWGRVGEMQEDIAKGLKGRSEGGTDNAAKFMKYCDREIKAFL